MGKEFDFPMPTYENLKPQKDDSVRLEITLTAEQFKELEEAKAFLSHVCHQGTWSEVIATLAEKFNKKRRAISKSAQFCCQYINPQTGGRCGSRYQLQFDHVIPIALGGTDHPKNLRVLCRTHNLFAAKQAGLKAVGEQGS